MNQDRRLNGWVMLASILGIVFGLALIVVGAGAGVWGFLKPDKLTSIKEIFFFTNQEGLVKLQEFIFNGDVLKTKFLYLALGIIIAVVGFLVLNFAIIALSYVKKRKVVRHRVAMLIFTLIPLAIAGCATTYLLLEKDILPDYIKYVMYGLIGVFGFISLCNIMGVMFGRSEKFMSNDNNKYAFDNSAIKNARVNVNNNVREAQMQNGAVARPVQSTQSYQQASQGYVNQSSTQARQPMQQPMRPVQRPAQAPMQRGMQPQRPMPQGQGLRPNQPMQPRPVQRPVQPGARPMQARPGVNPNVQGSSRPVTTMSNNSAPVRPGAPTRPAPVAQRPNMPSQKYCKVCGKVLATGEKICNVCGNRVED